MESKEEISGGTPGRWREVVVIDEARGVSIVEEPAAKRQVWLIRVSAEQRADDDLMLNLGAMLERLAAVQEAQLGLPVTGWPELMEAGEIGFAIPAGQLWGDVFPLKTKAAWPKAKACSVSFVRLLEAAARHGLVDGSLHPSRVWMAADGRILVPGFGFGSRLDPATQNDVRRIWFSPQAADGFPVVAADDVYSVGAMIYQAATGATPLDPNNLVYEIRYTTPAPAVKAGAQITVRGSETLAACLEKDPAKRPATLAALFGGFEEVDAPAPQKGKPFIPLEFDPGLSQSNPLPPMPSMGPMRPLLLRPEVWFATIVMLSALGLGAWMIWFSWPKEKSPLKPTSEEVLVAKNRELEAQLDREANSRGATHGFADIPGVTNLAQLLAPATNDFNTPVPAAAPDKRSQAQMEEVRKASRRKAAEIIEEAQRLADDKLRQEREAAEKKRLAVIVKEEAKFVSIFNGKDLKGWVGDRAYWSVQNGTLTGWIGADATPGTIGWLTCSQPEVGDFELRGQFRLRLLRDNRAGSAAVLYRALPGGRDGYHFVLGFDPSIIGSVVGNSGRGILAIQGQMTEQVAAASARPIITALPEAAAAQSAIRMNDWNEFRIVARGDTITHEINGQTVARLKDGSPIGPRRGLISLRVGGETPACVVQFKELTLRRE
jgi:hypothetical protein